MYPTLEYRRTSHRKPEPLLKGIDSFVHAAIGVYRRRGGVLDELRGEAEKIDALESSFKDLTDHSLREKLLEFRQNFRGHAKPSEETVRAALAAVREAASRQTGLHPYLEQLMGALALFRGYLAEMATGEGKTLTAGLAATLLGWAGHPCHVVTVNDYLVQRDAEWLKPLYHFAGLRVGFVTSKLNPEERRKAYGCDVTYTTSKEVLADFLRDRIMVGILQNPTRRLIRRMLIGRTQPGDGLVMRGLHTAIIDEADSVLIDEAVTPLIISTPRKNDALREVVQCGHELVGGLERDRHYHTNHRYQEIEFTSAGLQHLEEQCSKLPGFWRGAERRRELVRQSLVAREFFLLGKQYVISEGKVVIVDEFTGRPMPQRSWRQGLHQAIEAKEGIEITDPTETIARLSFQRFFRLYERLSGMTGTAREAAAEFWQIYRLPVTTIPTHKPCVRVHLPDRVFANDDAKWNALVEDIVQTHSTGRPILIGTRSVAASEKLGRMLQERGLAFRLLNAVRHQEEAQIVAEAGQRGKITIATNMAGRGTDIKLEAGVAELGGLHVIATERHESGRVDRQLFGRSARQGDPGSAQAFVSAEDELLRRYLNPSWRRWLKRSVDQNSLGNRWLSVSAFGRAQKLAQRLAFRQRSNVLRMDNWLDEALSFAGPDAA